MIAEPRRALLVSPTEAAQDAAVKLMERRDWVPLEDADMVVALGGDGFMLQTLHQMLERRRIVPAFGMNLGTVGFWMNEWRDKRLDERIEAARRTGFAIKINMVALNGINDDEIVAILAWCGARDLDLSLIETMPIGAVDDVRADRFFPLTEARARIEQVYGLIPSTRRTGGPARYWQVPALGITLGLISPLTRNFCDSCNRVRVSASGQLYMCLGHEDKVDLRAAMRSGGAGALDATIGRALRLKPARHDFDLATPATARHMNVTGG